MEENLAIVNLQLNLTVENVQHRPGHGGGTVVRHGRSDMLGQTNQELNDAVNKVYSPMRPTAPLNEDGRVPLIQVSSDPTRVKCENDLCAAPPGDRRIDRRQNDRIGACN